MSLSGLVVGMSGTVTGILVTTKKQKKECRVQFEEIAIEKLKNSGESSPASVIDIGNKPRCWTGYRESLIAISAKGVKISEKAALDARERALDQEAELVASLAVRKAAQMIRNRSLASRMLLPVVSSEQRACLLSSLESNIEQID